MGSWARINLANITSFLLENYVWPGENSSHFFCKRGLAKLIIFHIMISCMGSVSESSLEFYLCSYRKRENQLPAL